MIAHFYFLSHPDETVFIDDNIANVDTANKMGIKSIFFQGEPQLRNELRNWNIIEPIEKIK
jgi:FMN phosphatase YigB (HAD superfamily)